MNLFQRIEHSLISVDSFQFIYVQCHHKLDSFGPPSHSSHFLQSVLVPPAVRPWPLNADAHPKGRGRSQSSESILSREARRLRFKVKHVRRMTRLIALHARPIVNMISIARLSLFLALVFDCMALSLGESTTQNEKNGRYYNGKDRPDRRRIFLPPSLDGCRCLFEHKNVSI